MSYLLKKKKSENFPFWDENFPDLMQRQFKILQELSSKSSENTGFWT